MTPDTEPTDIPNVGSAETTVVNTGWSYASFLASKLGTFVAGVILARLLTPAQFGIVAFGLIAIQYLDVLGRFGLDAALISRRSQLQEAANAVFVVGGAAGILLYAISYAGAPAVATFFDEPRLVDIFRVLALVLILETLAVVPTALIRRRLQFRLKMVPDIGKSLVKGGVSIGMALAGFGVWSLVWGQLAGSATSLILMWVIAKWRPTRAFDRTVTREVLRFGIHLVSVETLGAFMMNGDYLFVGRLLGDAALGLYQWAYKLPDLLVNNINYVVGQVAHPVLSRIQDDADHVRTYYRSYTKYIALVTFPIGSGLALIAEPFVEVVLGPAWSGAIAPMRWVAIALAIDSVAFIPGVLYKAINRPDILTRVSFIRLPFLIAGLWYATRFGITAVAIMHAVLSLIDVAVNSIVVNRVIGFPSNGQIQAMTPPILGAAAMVGAVLGLYTVVPPDSIGALITAPVVGAAIYLGVIRVLAPETLQNVWQLVRNRFLRQPAASGVE